MEALYDRPFTDFERYVPCGPPESVAAQLQPYVAAGIRCFEIIPSAEDPIAGLEAVRRVREALVATRGDA